MGAVELANKIPFLIELNLSDFLVPTGFRLKLVGHSLSKTVAPGTGFLEANETRSVPLTAPEIPAERGFYDECLKGVWQFSVGFMKSSPLWPFGNPGSFGSPGAGGSFGYADPQAGMGGSDNFSPFNSQADGKTRLIKSILLLWLPNFDQDQHSFGTLKVGSLLNGQLESHFGKQVEIDDHFTLLSAVRRKENMLLLNTCPRYHGIRNPDSSMTARKAKRHFVVPCPSEPLNPLNARSSIDKN